MNYLTYKNQIILMDYSKKLNFLSDGRNHYVYRITNLITNKHYYGSRVTKLDPKEDLGIKYFSSSSVKEFLIEQKQNPKNFKYKIIRVTDNHNDNIIFESFIHEYFKVSHNNNFINKSLANPFYWNTTGLKHSTNTKSKISKRLNELQPSGLKLSNEIGKKGASTRKTIQQNGLSINQFNGMKLSKYLKSIDPNSGKSHAEIRGMKIKGKNHGTFKGYYIFNDKKFESAKLLADHIGISQSSAIKWCKKNCDIITKSSYYQSQYLKSLGGPEIIGTTFKKYGFDFLKI